METNKKPGKGRHGRRATPDVRHPNDVKSRAEARFAENAMPLAVSAELGVPYRTVWGWRQRWLLAKVEPSNADHGDEA